MNPYDIIATYYDFEHDGLTADVELYRQMARAHGGPILIAGVGTGRIARPLASDGYDIVGFDSNSAMLSLCRTKLSGFPNVTLFAADLREFSTEMSFPIVIVPLDVLTGLQTSADQLCALENLQRNLADGGLLILDIVNPFVLPTPSENGLIRRRFQIQTDDRTVAAFDSVEVDSASQTMTMHLTYETVQAEAISRETTTLTIRWLYRFELELALRAASLELKNVYGDYDLVPYESGSPRLIVNAVRIHD